MISSLLVNDWIYFSFSYSVPLNIYSQCGQSGPTSSFTCIETPFTTTVIIYFKIKAPVLNFSANDFNIMLDTSGNPSCSTETFYIKNYRFFEEYKYPNQFSLMRFKNINGYYYDKLLFNFYFEEGSTFVHNFIRRGTVNYSTSLESNFDNVNLINLSGNNAPNYQVLNRITESLKLCNSEMNKVSFLDPCTCILFINIDEYYEKTVLANIMTQFSYSLPNNISTELLIEAWIYPLSITGNTYTIWELNNNSSPVFILNQIISSTQMTLFLNANTIPISTLSTTFSSNKWIFIQSGISYSSQSCVQNNSIILTPSLSSLSSNTIPISISGVTLTLTKNYFGYIRNFRIWNDFSSNLTYFTNRQNTPLPIYFSFNNSLSNKLIISIPANHSGLVMYNEMNYSSNTSAAVSGEYNSNYALPGSIKSKTTGYVSRSTLSNDLIICEGNTVYDSTTNSCLLQSKFIFI